MSREPNPTKGEHYIPRMYLRGFSEITKSGTALMWQFDLERMRQTATQVNVRDVCFKKNLYEIRDSDGSFIARNRIENVFSRIELNTDMVIRSIQDKAERENCLNCPHILSENDKSYLIVFMTSLLYRDPLTIERYIAYLQSINPDMDNHEARNSALLNLLPLGLDSSWDENTLIRTALGTLSGMAFQIGISSEDALVTSDRPIILWPSKEDELYSRPGAVALPLTSKIVLYLYPFENVDPIARNCFIKLSKEQIDGLCHNIAVFARRWIYSRNPITKEQEALIRRARCGSYNEQDYS